VAAGLDSAAYKPTLSVTQKRRCSCGTACAFDFLLKALYKIMKAFRTLTFSENVKVKVSVNVNNRAVIEHLSCFEM